MGAAPAGPIADERGAADGLGRQRPRPRSRPDIDAQTRSGGTRPASAIYEGTVFHARTEPVRHAFSYRIFMPLFDLDELPGLLDPIPLWSARRRAPARLRRSDFLGDRSRPLADCARELVAAELGSAPAGPVRLLANPRYWGVNMNPVAFYYLHGDGPGEPVEAIIAEVTNTPWGDPELRAGARSRRARRRLRQGAARLPVHADAAALQLDRERAGQATRGSAPQPRRWPAGVRDGDRAAPSRDHAASDGRAARPLPADDGRDFRADLRERAEAEAEGAPYFRNPGKESELCPHDESSTCC